MIRATDPNDVQKYLISRANVFYDMRQWQSELSYLYILIQMTSFLDFFDDIKRIELYGRLHVTLSTLKM
jgi:hypothetical protein